MKNMEKMGIFFSVILICITLFFVFQTGPSNPQNISSKPGDQTYPTSTITKTVTQTTIIPSVNVTTTVPSIVVTTPSSNFCDQLKLNSNDDSAFMTFVQDNNIITRISKLPLTKLNDYSYNCDKAGAISLNQLILTHVKPKSTTLIQAREFLISATTYCQVPDSASASRTQDDLKKYSEKVDEYRDEVAPCLNSGGVGSSSEPAGASFHGYGNDIRSFTATEGGLRIFTMSHTGTHTFAVILKDSGGKYVTSLANKIGSYSGKKSEQLTSGIYYLDVTADGSWIIEIASV